MENQFICLQIHKLKYFQVTIEKGLFTLGYGHIHFYISKLSKSYLISSLIL